jgi:hypothetical protein
MEESVGRGSRRSLRNEFAMNKKILPFIFMFVSAFPLHTQSQPDIKVDNTAVYRGSDQWEWTIFIRASDKILDSIQYVQYTLHPTFYDPIQKVYKTAVPAYPFGLTRTGWGVFDVPVKVVFKDGSQQTLQYTLRFQDATSAPKCRDPFTVKERHFVHLDDKQVKRDIYVYIGEIEDHTKKPLYGAVFFGDVSRWGQEGRLGEPEFRKRIKEVAENDRWSSSFQDIGDSLVFRSAGNSLSLRLVKLASENAILRICEQ